MELAVHDKILQRACVLAYQRGGMVKDPRPFLPLMVRGSFFNDVNQASILTDKLAKLDAMPAIQHGIGQFWAIEAQELVEAMKQAPTLGAAVANEAAGLLATVPSNTINDIGKYNRFDHLDVLFDADVNVEVPKPQRKGPPPPVGTTVAKTRRVIADRLELAAMPLSQDRFHWARVTTLGRALHTIADFFAHTTYVELLLWKLALVGPPNGLSETVIQTFNSRPFDYAEPWKTICPLPVANDVAIRLKDGGGLFLYHESPDTTPLVAPVFDTSDTICTLLGIYAKHLKEMDSWTFYGTGPKPQETAAREQYLDTAMAFIDLAPSRKRLLKMGYKFYMQCEAAVKGVGQSVRNTLASMIEKEAAKHPSEKGVFDVTARVVRAYDSKLVAQWGSAGTYEGIVQVLANDMHRHLFNAQQCSDFVLPHHTLLRKDYEPTGNENVLRFNLACTLAVEVTARVISWYFSASPEMGKVQKILNDHLCHPCSQICNDDQHRALSNLVASLNGPAWAGLPQPACIVFSDATKVLS